MISSTSAIPFIQSSELRQLRVVFFHPDPLVCDEFEARAEQSLSRIDFYTASTLSAGRDILRRYNCQLAIFPDGLDGKDFVFTQLELKNAASAVRMIPLIDIPTIEQLSAQRRIGGIHTFGKKEDANSFAAVSAMILNFARDLSKSHPDMVEYLKYGKVLQNFLFALNPENQEIKKISTQILNELLLKYDWNPEEALRIVTAEMLYSPDLTPDKYANILGEDKFQLVEWLMQTASWLHPNSKPTGAGGFAITLANHMAWQTHHATNREDIVASVETTFKRPHFLLHPSIRVLKRQDLINILEVVTNQTNQHQLKVKNAG